MSSEIILAHTALEAFAVCDPDMPLEDKSPYYVNLDEVRAQTDVPKRLTKMITSHEFQSAHPVFANKRQRFLKILFSGHRGSGKSTELFRTKAALEEKGYHVVYIDLIEPLESSWGLNPTNVGMADILLAMIGEIVQAINHDDTLSKDIWIPDRMVERLVWEIAETIYEKTDAKALENQASVGLEAGTPNWLVWVKVLGNLRIQLKQNHSQQETFRRKVEMNAHRFLDSLNDILNLVQTNLKSHARKKGLVVLLDSLEKIVPARTENQQSVHQIIFMDQAELLKRPACHIVYTVPINLMHTIPPGTFDDSLIIPMVKIKRHDGSPFDEGEKKLRATLEGRMALKSVFEKAVFEHQEAKLKEVLRLSGGHVRDLLRMIRQAAIFSDGDQISVAALERAMNTLIEDYRLLIKQDHLDILIKVFKNKQLPADLSYADLAYKLLLLEYRNDEGWADVHPAVQKTRIFKEALNPKLGAE